jgi:hypothetical protein
MSADGTQLTFTAGCTSTGEVEQADGTRTLAPGSCEGTDGTPRIYRVDFKFVAPAQDVSACDDGSKKGRDGATIISSSYDARTLTQTVLFTTDAGHAASPAAATQKTATTACVQLGKPAAASFVDPMVSASRFVQLRGRAHRLKATVDKVGHRMRLSVQVVSICHAP